MICCLIIFYQYNGVLSVLVVESCPSVVACGQYGGVAPTWADTRGVARMGFDYSYSIYAILSLPTDVRVLVVPPHLSPFADRSVRRRDACGRTDCQGHGLGKLLCESVA